MGSESMAHDVVLFSKNKQTPPQLLVLSLVCSLELPCDIDVIPSILNEC